MNQKGSCKVMKNYKQDQNHVFRRTSLAKILMLYYCTVFSLFVVCFSGVHLNFKLGCY